MFEIGYIIKKDNVKSNIFKAEMIEASYMINLWFKKNASAHPH